MPTRIPAPRRRLPERCLSALLVAALANGPWGGALVMAVFAAASGTALGVGPLLWRRWMGNQADPGVQARWSMIVTRLSGATLAVASLWALGHDVFSRFLAWCVS